MGEQRTSHLEPACPEMTRSGHSPAANCRSRQIRAAAGSQVRDALLSEHVFQKREDVRVRFLRRRFVVVERHTTLETRIGRTERLFRLYIKNDATFAFDETASARRETLLNSHHLGHSWPVEEVMGIRILDVADVLACLRETRCILTAWSRGHPIVSGTVQHQHRFGNSFILLEGDITGSVYCNVRSKADIGTEQFPKSL